MLRFSTANSEYELDETNSRIRRLSGLNDPTPRQGVDGVWQTYASVTRPNVGGMVLIDWTGDGCCTMSSPVTFIESTRV